MSHRQKRHHQPNIQRIRMETAVDKVRTGKGEDDAGEDAGWTEDEYVIVTSADSGSPVNWLRESAHQHPVSSSIATHSPTTTRSRQSSRTGSR